eukprot:s2532_g3.t1
MYSYCIFPGLIPSCGQIISAGLLEASSIHMHFQWYMTHVQPPYVEKGASLLQWQLQLLGIFPQWGLLVKWTWNIQRKHLQRILEKYSMGATCARFVYDLLRFL